ncbi:MAG: aldose 1-epimerase family protein [Armatimonadota bacterium]
MAELYGRSYTREELTERVGSMDQVAGVRRITLADGNEKGVDAFEVRTGGGLDFTVLAGRGMDVGQATYRSYPLAWQSCTGVPAASYFEPEGLGWLRGFHGGLVTTCGLTYAGAPATDGEEQLGLHGRVSYTPARHISSGASWHNGDYLMYVEGQMREASVFGPNMVLTRRISSMLGHPVLHIQDVVENQGFQPQEHMLVYHCNLGFPLMDATTELVAPSREVVGQEEFAQETVDSHASFDAPQQIDERVYYHQLHAAEDGSTQVGVVNRELGAGVGIYFNLNVNELPYLVQWKMPGQGTYVMGIEPANCHVEGRPAERERGTLQVMEPGESRSYTMTIGIVEGPEGIDQLVSSIRSLG